MGVEGHVGPGSESGIDSTSPYPVVDVRKVGSNVFEARDREAHFSAIGYTEDDAVTNVRARLPKHKGVWVWYTCGGSAVLVC